ncbi:MAG: peroxiredoxin [Candidatus Sungiibacteriota bacterium]|uniref:Peroxiredoxin n=1 Tax=Candidatus Sungiibacteriota bacterium TaxID=2750080 RepID=A0A7T5RK08_9BACT|nr:MAG: peroxiredoxin [Candidatus Sungbacteria bacterium]
MFTVDKKFPHFSLEVYNPEKEAIERIDNKNFAKRWLILFFYPADFTFVCPTELRDLKKFQSEFKKLKTEVVVASTDTVYTHKAWVETEGLLKGLPFLMAADHNGKFSRELGIYNEEKGMAQRAVFIVDPEGALRAVEIVTDVIGRNTAEILRKLKALQYVKSHPGNVCPASWEEGEATIKPSIKKAGRVYQELR